MVYLTLKLPSLNTFGNRYYSVWQNYNLRRIEKKKKITYAERKDTKRNRNQRKEPSKNGSKQTWATRKKQGTGPNLERAEKLRTQNSKINRKKEDTYTTKGKI